MTERLRIAGGRVYDPANRVDGEVRDVCIEDGRIVADLAKGAPVLDATGLVVMPGGVDIHGHIAGPKVNHARRLSPDQRRRDPFVRRPGLARSGTVGTVPSTFATGYLYAGLGYTTAFEAAVPLLGARHAHHELDDTPMLDKGFYVVLGNDERLLRDLAAGEREKARHGIAWAVAAARAYGVKVVSPGAVDAWKGGRTIGGLDDEVRKGVTPRAIVEAIASAVDDLGLPHPMHIHCNNLGLPGNAATTLETMRAVAGRRAHFAHVQFHSYGEAGGRPTSAAREIAEHLNAHANLSADVGQVMFGPAMAMTGDSRVGAMLHDLNGGKWVDRDVELEGGCGIVPYEYKAKNAMHALQWAVGLEIFLLAKDPWRVVLSTDHPNGGTFLRYPRLIRLLMDRAFRDEQIKMLKPDAIKGTALADGLDREYTLGEIAIVTRAGPARLLGLRHKGHLGVGADADVTLYAPSADIEAMFAAPRYVLKGGVRVAEEGQARAEVFGKTLCVAPQFDRGIERGLRRFFETEGSVGFDDYVIGADEVRDGTSVPLIGAARG